MLGRVGVGKGLNVKGKSATEGPLAGFVPFVQIHEEAHKAQVGISPPGARTRVFWRSESARDAALRALEPMLERAAAYLEARGGMPTISGGAVATPPAEMVALGARIDDATTVAHEKRGGIERDEAQAAEARRKRLERFEKAQQEVVSGGQSSSVSEVPGSATKED